MRDLIHPPSIVANPIFQFSPELIFGRLYYHDKTTKTNYLFVIHQRGIIKYDMDLRVITKQYSHHWMIFEPLEINKCGIDPIKEIMYFGVSFGNRIWTFNLKTKQ